ncbi:MAG: AMP-dependent synthetase/ligase [Terriglobia bacterium]
MVSQNFPTLNELFLAAIAKHAKPDAFLFKRQGKYEGLSSVYALQQVAALAVSFGRLGIQRGDRVAILSENRVEWPVTDYALLGIGAIDVPVYPTLPAADVEYIMRHSGSRAIVVSTPSQLEKVLQIRPHLPELLFTVVMEPLHADLPGVQWWSDMVQESLARSLDPERDFRTKALEAQPQDTATILYTSGTTGRPKGVVLTHANIVSNIKATEPLFDFGPADRAISFLPLCHVFERTLEYFLFSHGVSIAYAESPEKLAENMLEARPTVMAVVPRVLEKAHSRVMDTVRHGPRSRQKLFNWAVKTGWNYASSQIESRSPSLGLRVKHAIADKLVGAKVRARFGGRLRFMISGSAPLTKELVEFFYAVGLPVYEGYGLTETSPVITVNYPGAAKPGTVGRVLSGVEIKFGEAPLEIEGVKGREILVRGPSVSPGYYQQEEENRQSFTGGWFQTGDLGELDADGYLKITGRKKNLLKTAGGKYISPEKIEELFQGHPLVTQIFVLGNSRRFVGALVVPRFDRVEAYARERQIAFTTREDLLGRPEICAWMQNEIDSVCAPLAPFEKIRQIALLPREFSVDCGELSPSLKIRRFIVEDLYREVIEEIYSRPAPQKV